MRKLGVNEAGSGGLILARGWVQLWPKEGQIMKRLLFVGVVLMAGRFVTIHNRWQSK